MGPRGLQELSCTIYPSRVAPFLGPSWAHLGLSWALLGPSWGVQGGILWQISGVQGGQTPRCEKHQKTCGKSTCLADSWRQQAFRTLAKLLFGRCGGGWVVSSVDVVVVGWGILSFAFPVPFSFWYGVNFVLV